MTLMTTAFQLGPTNADESQAQERPIEPSLQGAILETLASAVVSFGTDGVITTFNSAAATMTGLDPQAVIGRTFAEVFMSTESAEEFGQAVLDAVYDGTPVRQRVIGASFLAGQRSLAMSVSYMPRRTGPGAGVAVVFDDISEVRELREKELSLAREVER